MSFAAPSLDFSKNINIAPEGKDVTLVAQEVKIQHRIIEPQDYDSELILDVFRFPGHYLLYLDFDYKKQLLEKADELLGSRQKVAKALGINHSTLYFHTKQGRKGHKKLTVGMGLRVSWLKQLAAITGTPLSEIRKHAFGWCYQGKHSKEIFTCLDIDQVTAARLLGIYMGQSKYKKRKFEMTAGLWYTDYLVETFSRLGIKPKLIGDSWLFPVAAMALIDNIGRFRGGFIDSPMIIPDWLMGADIKVKREFLRYLFNTCSNVKYLKDDMKIRFSRSRREEYAESLEIFMNQVRQLLIEVGVKPRKLQPQIKRKDVPKPLVRQYFEITGLKNQKAFRDEIGFFVPEKKEKLDRVIKYRERCGNWGREDARHVILEHLEKDGALHTREILERLSNREPRTIEGYLYYLAGKGEIWRLIGEERGKFHVPLRRQVWDIKITPYISEKAAKQALLKVKEELGNPAAAIFRDILETPMGLSELRQEFGPAATYVEEFVEMGLVEVQDNLVYVLEV